MNRLKLISVFLLIFFGWNSASSQDAPSEKGKRATVYPDQMIDWYTFSGNYSVKFKEGDQLVFEVISETGIDKRNDTMIKSVLYFSINPEKQSFHFKDNFEGISAFLRRHCRCLDAGFNKVKSGSITGDKIANGEWKLQIDIIAIGNNLKNEYPFQYSGIATIEE